MSKPPLGDDHVPYLVVAVVRRAVLVTAGVAHPHAAVRRRLDRPQAAEGTAEELLHVGQAAAADDLAVQPGTPLTRDVQHVADDGDTRARTLRDWVGVLRRDQAGLPAAAGTVRSTFADRPAVVAALLDEVRLVHDAVAELLLPQPALGVERQTLRVAVPVAPHGVAERVVRRDAAVRVDPQHLAVEAVLVLRVVAVLRVTGTGEQELAVRAGPEPAAVEELVLQDPAQQRSLRAHGHGDG